MLVLKAVWSLGVNNISFSNENDYSRNYHIWFLCVHDHSGLNFEYTTDIFTSLMCCAVFDLFHFSKRTNNRIYPNHKRLNVFRKNILRALIRQTQPTSYNNVNMLFRLEQYIEGQSKYKSEILNHSLYFSSRNIYNIKIIHEPYSSPRYS